MTDPVPPEMPPTEMLQSFAEAVGASLAARGAGGGVERPEAGVGGLTGGFDLVIQYNGVDYILKVEVPATATDPYVFTVAEKPATGTEKVIASFKFVDATRWAVDVGLPEIPIGSVTIKELRLKLAQGTPFTLAEIE